MRGSKGQPGSADRADAGLQQSLGLCVARPHRAPRDEANQKARARTQQCQSDATRSAQPEATRRPDAQGEPNHEPFNEPK